MNKEKAEPASPAKSIVTPNHHEGDLTNDTAKCWA